MCTLVGLLQMSSGQTMSDSIPIAYSAKPFQAGEILRYKVKWIFIRLGTIVLTQQLVDSTDSSKFLVTMHAESAWGLPFVDVFFEDRSILFSHSVANVHFTHESGRDEKSQLIYRYNSKTRHTITEQWKGGELLTYDSTAQEGSYYDAVGLFMLTRCLSGSGLAITAPTIMESELKDTKIQFTDEVEEIRVDALDHPVRARRIEGRAEWVNKSAAGMKGPFSGWISDDDAGIPLKADLKIFLGSITLELESYSRPGWLTKATAPIFPKDKQ